MKSITSLACLLAEKSKSKKPLIVGVSGIDGSGKGYVSKKLQDELGGLKVKVALVGIDGWLQPPSKRFSQENPAEHFYKNGFRFDEFQKNLFNPLSEFGSILLKAKHSSPDNSEELVYYIYDITDADIVIFEGIFLLQPRFVFDHSIWIDCSFETAFQRALERNQEGISEDQMREDYDKIYFAAQKIHLKKDSPKTRADYVYINDFRLDK